MITIIANGFEKIGEISEFDYGLIYGLLSQIEYKYLYDIDGGKVYNFFDIIKINETTYDIREYEIIKLIKSKLLNIKIYSDNYPFKNDQDYSDYEKYPNFRLDNIFSNFLYRILELKIFTDDEFEIIYTKLYEEYSLIINKYKLFYIKLYEKYLSHEYTGEELLRYYARRPIIIYLKYNLKNNNDIEYYEYLKNLYIIKNKQPIKATKLNVYFINFIGIKGDRLGNELFGFFKSLAYIYTELMNLDSIEYIFLYISVNYHKRFSKLLDKCLFIKAYDNITQYYFTNIELTSLPQYYAHDTLALLLKSNKTKEYFIDFINKNTKIFKLKLPEKKNQIKISLHYRLSDFCAGNTDESFFNEYMKIDNSITQDQLECYNNNTIVSNEGEQFNILSYIYYKNIIDKIILQNPDKEFQIIIYYLKTKIDDIIIYLLIEYIKKNIDIKIKINFETEYTYYDENNYNEFELIYNASLNDKVILSNSTFGFWMVFFKILSDYKNNDTLITSIYYGKYLNYSYTSEYLLIDQMLDIEKKVYIPSNLLNFGDCSIDNSEIYYFYCLEYDMIRIFLVILYFKLKYNKNIDEIDDEFINKHSKYDLLPSKCFYFIKKYNSLYKKDYDKSKFSDDSKIDFKFIGIYEYSQLLKKILNYNNSHEELNDIINNMSAIYSIILKNKEIKKSIKYQKNI